VEEQLYYRELGAFLNSPAGKEFKKRLAINSGVLMQKRERILNVTTAKEFEDFSHEYLVLQNAIKFIDIILSDVLCEEFVASQLLTNE